MYAEQLDCDSDNDNSHLQVSINFMKIIFNS